MRCSEAPFLGTARTRPQWLKELFAFVCRRDGAFAPVEERLAAGCFKFRNVPAHNRRVESPFNGGSRD